MSKADEYFDIIIKHAENLEDGTYCFIEEFDKSDRDWLDAFCMADNVCRRKLDIHASYDSDKICLKSKKPKVLSPKAEYVKEKLSSWFSDGKKDDSACQDKEEESDDQ
jgi:hypothetical protein